MDILKQLAEDLRLGEDDAVRAGTEAALAADLAPDDILRNGLLAGMAVVGEEFGRREIFLPDVLLAARAMQAGMEVLKPHLARDGAPPAGRVVLGTVQGDLHDIGKNLVGILLRGAGWEVIDLGTDVPAARFLEAAESSGARVIGLSALLTTTMTGQRELVRAIAGASLPRVPRVLVGGAPTTPAWAAEIGAVHAENALRAVSVAREILS